MRLTEVCDIQMGFTPRGRLESVKMGGVPAIQLRDISPDGRIDPASLSRFLLNDLPERYFAQAGDILFRSRGERNTATVVDDRFQEPVVVVLPLFLLRPRTNRVLPDYLAWVINQAPAQRHFDSSACGTSLRMVSKSSLDQLELDVPPFETQRMIIMLDALAERERELSEKASRLRRLLLSRILVEHARHLSPKPNKKGK